MSPASPLLCTALMQATMPCRSASRLRSQMKLEDLDETKFSRTIGSYFRVRNADPSHGFVQPHATREHHAGRAGATDTRADGCDSAGQPDAVEKILCRRQHGL